jgi:hypothetical protein
MAFECGLGLGFRCGFVFVFGLGFECGLGLGFRCGFVFVFVFGWVSVRVGVWV